jgi:tagatose-1,6-bisphosphate aldolase
MTTSATILPGSLRALATPKGAVGILALDHRDALRNAFARLGLSDVSDTARGELKGRILDAVASSATAVLLDVDTFARRPPGTTTLVPLEAQGHAEVAGGRRNALEAFGPEDAQRLGAHGCKLLLYYRADHSATADDQRRLATQVAERCHACGLVLVVEPKVYRLAGETEDTYRGRYAEHVTAAAAAIAETGADLLKLQFPGDQEACRRVAAAAGSVPWTLLGGAGVDGETFATQVRVATKAGACGFIAGRPIWGGALALPAAEQGQWLDAHARPLLARLVEITEMHSRRHG